MAKDYYKILGLERNASVEDIGKAYRELARKYHPDLNKEPDAAEHFKEVSQAFEILNNPDKRREYDQFGEVRGAGPTFSNMHIDPFNMFEDLFRSHSHPGQYQTKGADVYKEVRITLAEAYHGCEKFLDLSNRSPCRHCEGTGAESWDACPACGGSGRINTQKGPFSVSITCGRCQGQGRFVKTKCTSCQGMGFVEGKVRKHKMDIPAGIESGMQIVIKGEGERIANGVPGDVACQIIIEPHVFYEREGSHLHCVVPITFAQSISGHDVELPVFGKVCKIHIPPQTKSGQVLRMKGIGMPVLINGYRQMSVVGDLLVRIQVESPKEPSPEFLKLIKKMAILDDKEAYEAIVTFKSQIEKLKE